MASKHILSLEVPIVTNSEILSIRDTSLYTDNLPVDYPELLVTVPGFNGPSLISVSKDFYINLTGCELGLQKENCETERVSLPDGVYIIRYSVSPNDKVYVEYNHLRVTNILSLYHRILCDIDISTCEPFSDRKNILEEIQYIRTLIDGAIAKVEYCNSPSIGMDMYNYALKRLNKLVCNTRGCH